MLNNKKKHVRSLQVTPKLWYQELGDYQLYLLDTKKKFPLIKLFSGSVETLLQRLTLSNIHIQTWWWRERIINLAKLCQKNSLSLLFTYTSIILNLASWGWKKIHGRMGRVIIIHLFNSVYIVMLKKKKILTDLKLLTIGFYKGNKTYYWQKYINNFLN